MGHQRGAHRGWGNTGWGGGRNETDDEEGKEEERKLIKTVKRFVR